MNGLLFATCRTFDGPFIQLTKSPYMFKTPKALVRNLSRNLTKSNQCHRIENSEAALKAIRIGKVGLAVPIWDPWLAIVLPQCHGRVQKKNLEGSNSTETRPVSTANFRQCLVLSCLLLLLVWALRAPKWLPSSKSKTWACCLVLILGPLAYSQFDPSMFPNLHQ